jgi:spore germination protein
MVILVSTINATGILSLPKDLVEEVGPDGWASLIIGHILAIVAVLIMIKLGNRFKGQTFIEYSQIITGSVIGSFLSLVAVIFWILITSRIVRAFADVVKIFLLPRTPVEIIILAMLLLSVYVARHGLEPIARMLEILFPILFLATGFIVIFAIPEIDLTNLQPVLASGFKPIALSGIKHALSLEGIEMFLLLLPFMLVPQRAWKVGVLGLTVNMLLRITVFVITVGVFGMHTKSFLWPMSILAKFLQVPGGILERLEIVFIAFWVTVAFSSIVVYNYLASLGLSRLLRFKEQSMLVVPILPLIYFIALIPANITTFETFTQYEEMVGATVGWVFPPLLLIIAWLRGISGKTPGSSTGENNAGI